MRRKLGVAVITMLLWTTTWAAVPKLIHFQGRLADAQGNPIDGELVLTFRLFDVESGGTALWTEVHGIPTAVPVSDGFYEVLLGSISPLNLSFDGDLWLSIQVESEPEMSPRHRLAASPYALNADLLDGQDSTAFSATGHQHSGADITTGTVTEARIDAAMARDTEILPAVLAGDGAGSTLDADLLDGQDSAAFMAAGTDNWVDVAGDTMTGSLNLPANGLVVGSSQIVASEGNVGVGAATPQARLEVAAGTAPGTPLTSFATIFANGSGPYHGILGQANSTNKWGGVFYNSASGHEVDVAGSSYGLVVKTGNVGIGTFTPTSLLEVNGEIAMPNVTNFKMNGRRAFRADGTILWISAWNEFTEVRIGNDPGGAQDVHLRVDGNVYPFSAHDLGTGTNQWVNVWAGTYQSPAKNLGERLEAHPDYTLPPEKLEELQSKVATTAEEETLAFEIEHGGLSSIPNGAVVIITPNGLKPCNQKNDTRLAGIVSNKPGVRLDSHGQGIPVALSGKVDCLVTGKIRAGELLTTSNRLGHATVATNPTVGAIVGKALEDFEGDSGFIRVWIGGF